MPVSYTSENSQNNHTERPATLLMIAQEDFDQYELVSRLLKSDSDFHLNIITSSTYPIEGDSSTPNIDHVTFIVDRTSTESYRFTRDTMEKLETKFLLGNTSVIFIKGECCQTLNVDKNQIDELINLYNVLPLHVNMLKRDCYGNASERLLKQLSTSAGFTRDGAAVPPFLTTLPYCDRP